MPNPEHRPHAGRIVSPLTWDRPAVAAAGLAAGSLLGFLAVWLLWACWPHGWPPGLDAGLLRLFRQPNAPGQLVGPAWLADLVRHATDLGDGLVLTQISLAAAVALFVRGRCGEDSEGSEGSLAGWWVLLTGLVGFAWQELLKWAIARPRPTVVPHLEAAIHNSFPSGHSMMSAVVYVTIALAVCGLTRSRAAKAVALSAAGGLTILVGLTRVILGVHYPTDVLGGWLAGLAWAMACWLAARWVRRREQIPARPA
jgi:undecaprenyl-diphosphatase